MTLHEKRVALAAIVRAADDTVTAADKIEAIRLDNRLAGHGSAARLNAAIAQFLAKPPE
ncbi:MAG: hypothetical protein JWL90_906 [Chthoniobacteraceae bacterium]|nr:hypothetical protein [Chthoniobacteraceae bacterium]